ncbi:50S ribosomal protein L10 [Pelagicoccus sp. NFK12]|uniref:Large ribosomal subunit protein uL10 n=1 Tax=Pelagicoccus enzymogenes TaxID=2773457 RepID=A0A927IHR6_9BACT|nr:50S ribosomal protein L10 [Pelagicoccus enzymogenes]MBD5782577.1 50S ribosomal protein L10 [Pelagicoccus enzymogenes]MDQ8199510.1 50S ribosomal protein L10 [Pelagicoccus enzymogenes]
MRPEKQFLVDEINTHLDKSDYLFLADYERSTVIDIAELRAELIKEEAEFHVVKNNILKVAARERGYPEIDEHLNGQNAIVIGGTNPSGVAKVLTKFFDKKDKMDVKVGILSSQRLEKDEVVALSKLPNIDAMRAQLLGLLSQPAQSLVFVLNGVPTAMLNVLQAKADKGE